MKTVLVTGSTGRVGMNLVKMLHERGYKTKSFAFDSPAEKQLREKLQTLGTEIVLGNLATGDGIENAVEGIDAVIHSGALMQEDRAPSRLTFFDINTRGTFCLLEAVRKRKDPIERFVGITTGAVYDVLSGSPPFKTTDVPEPLSLYGLTKVLNEQLYRLFYWQHNIPTVTLRPNLILGGTEPIEVWSAKYIINAMKGACSDPRTMLYTDEKEPWKKIESIITSPDDLVIPYGPGHKSWRWHGTDVRDVCSAAIAALETDNPAAIGGIFNVASEKPQDYSDVLPYLAKKLNKPYLEVELPVHWHVELDITSAMQVLGYKPQYTIEDMIDAAIAFSQGHDTGVIPPGIPH